MKHIAFVLKERAMGGDLAAIKLLFQYVLGKPTQTVDPDRLDVDEWQKMQEQSRPPAEVHQVMSGLPAGTIADVTNVAWPCAVEQAFNQPFLAGLKKMDERDAHAADSKKPQAERDRPSPKGGNGRQANAAPMANGLDEPPLEWWEQLMEKALAEASGGKTATPMTNGENGKG